MDEWIDGCLIQSSIYPFIHLSNIPTFHYSHSTQQSSLNLKTPQVRYVEKYVDRYILLYSILAFELHSFDAIKYTAI